MAFLKHSLALTGVFLVACSTGPQDMPVASGEAAAPVRITILHTNDHHGRFWRSANKEYGLAARKTLIDAIRQEVKAAGGHTLLLDGGDVNTGVPESDMQQAEPDFRGMSRLGYDAMAVGNHEFDTSLSVLQTQQKQWSAFPWLSANIYRNGSRMFEPYRVFRLGPVKLAVLGLTTEDTSRMIDAQKFPGVSFTSPADEALKIVPELRREADIVVAATHMGHYTDGRHGSNAPGDVELARAVPGIDLIVGGHSQNVVCMLAENIRNDAYEPGGACAPDRQNGAWIVQAGEWGKFVGRADFEYRDGALHLLKYTLIPVNLRKTLTGAAGKNRPAQLAGPEIAEDQGMLALLQPYQERGAASLSVPVGRTDGVFDGERASIRSKPTNLGALITTAMREVTRADFAIVSSGGIRDSLPMGPISYRHLLQVHPFGNRIVTVTMTGAQVRDYLGTVAAKQPGSGAFPQYSGLHFIRLAGMPQEIRINGKPLDPNATYRMAINSFIARGGDGYPDITTHAGYADTGRIDADVLREFIARRDVVRTIDYAPK